jgi:WD40 repeat protein
MSYPHLRAARPVSSGSLDCKVKIWDVVGPGRPVKRTYLGHTGAVRQVNFNNDGRRCVCDRRC